jgi:integrase
LNPGSPAPQASVLIQPRLRARLDTCLTNVIKPIPPQIEANIINTIIKLKSAGFEESTLKYTNYKLRQLARNVNLNDPEAVKHYISIAKNQLTGEDLSNDRKNNIAYSYDLFCQVNGIVWQRPWYTVKESVPDIPTKEDVTAIINNASERYTIIFTLLEETGAEGHELELVAQNDINKEQGTIIIKGNKGHASGTYKLRTRTAEMLRVYLYKNPQEHPFPTSKIMGDVWRDTRRRAAKKLCKPELDLIPLKALRNYSGAQYYYKTQDPIGTMRHLRHKKLETTMHYLRKIALANTEEEWICKSATDAREAAMLIEQGFTCVDTIDGIHLYRKRK